MRFAGLRIYDSLPVVRIEVDDHDPTPPPSTPGSGAAGTGLGIVAALASTWGCSNLPDSTTRNEPEVSDGKTVWCELTLTA